MDAEECDKSLCHGKLKGFLSYRPNYVLLHLTWLGYPPLDFIL